MEPQYDWMDNPPRGLLFRVWYYFDGKKFGLSAIPTPPKQTQELGDEATSDHINRLVDHLVFRLEDHLEAILTYPSDEEIEKETSHNWLRTSLELPLFEQQCTECGITRIWERDLRYPLKQKGTWGYPTAFKGCNNLKGLAEEVQIRLSKRS